MPFKVAFREPTVWRVRMGLAGLVVLLGLGLVALVVWHAPAPGGTEAESRVAARGA
jgi:hypothetical protein